MGAHGRRSEPENIGYRISVRTFCSPCPDGAIRACRTPPRWPKTAEEIIPGNRFLMSAQAFASARQRRSEMQNQAANARVDVQTQVDATSALAHHGPFVPEGPLTIGSEF
jgi:hypothetical protein